jgi:DNA invertase Pin-like site-specific DNA recombinase
MYVRISQDREGAGLGVERQEKDCRKLADQLGWTVRDVYCDNDISAYSGKRRPKYEELLADIEAGRIAGVLAWHPDRLHRSPLELERYIELSEIHGVQTHTVQAGRWDLSTPSGRAVARTLGAWARYESEHKGERIKARRVQQAKNGEFKGGIRPFGFEKDGVTVRPDEAAEVVKATEAVVTAQSLRSLVRSLNERGVSTVTGKGPWTSVALKEMLMRPRNAGLSSYHGEIMGKAVWPALVPVETWQAACAILSDASRRHENHRGGLVRWLGSGLYVCGVCQQADLRVGATTARRGNNKRYTYRCRNREYRNGTGHVTREANALDRYVEELLVGRISDPRVLKKLRETPAGDGIDTRALQVELTAMGTREETLGQNYALGKISERVMNSGMDEITKRRAEINDVLERAGKRTPLDPFNKAKDAADVHRIWYGPGGADGDREGGLSLGARRAILSRLVTITVNPMPTKPTRQPDGSFLDRDSIDPDWKKA